ncbi:MAG: DUF4403 family protein [Bacteroidetes bacterium]|nr:DUF4403 family protein [Bacteroidota bacterium]
MNVFYPIKYFTLIGLICAAVFVVSCHSTKKVMSTAKHTDDSLPPLPQSQIDIPIKIYAPPIFAKAEKIVPKEFTSDTWPNFLQPSCDFRYKYRFERSVLAISCSNNIVGIQFTGAYQLSGSRCLCTAGKPVTPWISGSCGFGKEPMRKMNVSIKSQLDFLPGYQVKTTTSLNKVEAIDKCFVSFLSSDVTQLVLDSVQSSVTSFCTALDETIMGLSFASLVREASGKSYQKTNLGKFGFLLVSPTALRIGQLNFVKDSFNIQAGISCKPSLSSDSINHISLLSTLPPLEQKENKRGVSLYLDANYDYAFLSKILADTLRNRVFEVKGRTIVVKDVQMRGIGNHQVELKIDFAGSNKGSISLRGTPVFDTAKQSLTIPDISYSLEAQDFALKLAKSLFRNKIRKTLQGNSYLDIGALVKSNMPLMNEQLNRQLTKGVYSSGKTNDIRIIGLMARDNAMQVQVFVDADLTISSDGVF